MTEKRKPEDSEERHYDEHGILILGKQTQTPEAEERAHRQAERTYQDQQTSLQRGILRTQILLVIFGLLGSSVSIWQAKTAQESADTSDKSALVAQRSERESVRSAEQARADAKAANDASRKQASDALQATVDNFQKDQRAWVGLTGFVVETDPLVKIDPAYKDNDIAVAGFLNSGKTPARKVSALVGVGFTMSDHALNKEDEEWMTSQIRNAQTGQAKLFVNSAPYANVTASYATDPRRFDIPVIEVVSMGAIAPNTTFRYVHPRDFHALPQSKMEVFVFGVITYTDVTNIRRSTKFCAYRPENWDEKLNACPIFNDMN